MQTSPQSRIGTASRKVRLPVRSKGTLGAQCPGEDTSLCSSQGFSILDLHDSAGFYLVSAPTKPFYGVKSVRKGGGSEEDPFLQISVFLFRDK